MADHLSSPVRAVSETPATDHDVSMPEEACADAQGSSFCSLVYRPLGSGPDASVIVESPAHPGRVLAGPLRDGVALKALQVPETPALYLLTGEDETE